MISPSFSGGSPPTPPSRACPSVKCDGRSWPWRVAIAISKILREPSTFRFHRLLQASFWQRSRPWINRVCLIPSFPIYLLFLQYPVLPWQSWQVQEENASYSLPIFNPSSLPFLESLRRNPMFGVDTQFFICWGWLQFPHAIVIPSLSLLRNVDTIVFNSLSSDSFLCE